MTFSSVLFLYAFCPALFVCYFFPPVRRRLPVKNLVLLVFSLGFYACGGLAFFPIILCSIFANYLFGLLISLCAPQRAGRRKALVVGAAVVNIGLLVCFKYLGFLTQNLHALIPSVPALTVVLPIGISFYTFQGLSYVIDVYRGDAQGERNPLKVALYVALFPQLVAGPIVRYTTVAQEISHREENLDEIYAGAVRFLVGLAKKVLISNQLCRIADAAFGQTSQGLSVGLAWLGALAYTGQIYFDFSGYSDMAIGLGRIFRFHFLENFNYPYISRSVTEFWRRWHISLSTWFRDYVYIPLGGNRGNRLFQIRNLAVVWLLTGFWHGAAWNYVLWGVYYGLLLMGERYLWGGLLKKCPRWVGHVYALVLVMVGWVIFRAESLGQIGWYLQAMFGGGALWSGQATYLILEYLPELLVGVVASMPLLPALKGWLGRPDHPGRDRFRTLAEPAAALVLGALSVVGLVSSGFNPFIYFQF